MWIWNGTYGGGSSSSTIYSVNQTLDGGFIMAGETEGFGAGLSDVYVIKTNDSGSSIQYDAVENIIVGYGYVKIYPNPFSTTSMVEFPDAIINEKKNLVFSIYDITGRKVNSYPVSSSHLKIGRDGLEQGMYFFRLEENTGQLIYVSGKLMIH